MAKAIEHLELGLQPLAVAALGQLDHHAPFGAGGEGIEGPEQGAGFEDQHPVLAPRRRVLPEALAQPIEPLALAAELPLQPAGQHRILGAAAEHGALLSLLFGGGGQLGGAPLLHAGAPLPFPTQLARLPKQLPLQGAGQVLLGDPVLGVGMGIAVAHAIAKGLAIAVGIAQVGGNVLAVAGLDRFQGIKKAEQAVAFFGAG